MKTQTRIGLSAGLTLALLAGLTPRAEAAEYKLTLAFTNYMRAEALTNFPVLVTFSNGLYGTFNYNTFTAPATGGDLRFTDSSETTNLDFEVESWNTNGASCAWVRVPQLSSNTTIWAKWGGADTTLPACTTNGAVWTNGFVGVWHLATTNSALSARDSTTYTNHGTISSATVATGKVDGAAYFNGSAAVSVRSLASVLNRVSVSAWVSATATVSFPMAFSAASGDADGSAGFELRLNGSGCPQIMIDESIGRPGATAASSIVSTGWRHLSGTYDGVAGNIVLYVDGVQAGTGSGSGNIAGLGATPRIGNRGVGGTSYPWTGFIDEVRVENVFRSSNWIWACYANMASNAFFNGYGTVQAPAGATALPQIQNRAPSGVGTNGATFNGTLVTNGAGNAAVYVAWGQTNASGNGAWATTNWWNPGDWTNGSYPSTNITTLTANANYYYTFGATNDTTNVVAGGFQYLITGELTVQATDPTGRVTLTDTAAFTVYRPATCTNEDLIVNYSLGGTATNGTHYTSGPVSGAVAIAKGMTNGLITVTSANMAAPEQTVILTLVPGPYAIGSASAATCTLVAASMTYNDAATGNWNVNGAWSPNTGYPASNDIAIIDSHTVTANISLTNPTAPASIVVATNGTVAHPSDIVVASPVTMNGGTWAQSGNDGNARRLKGAVTVQSDSLFTGRRGGGGIWLDGPVTGDGKLTFRGVDSYQVDGPDYYLTCASNAFSGGIVVESNYAGVIAVSNRSLGTGDITLNNLGSLWFQRTQDYSGASRTPSVTMTSNTCTVGFNTTDGMTVPFDLFVQGGGKMTMDGWRENEVWSGGVTLNANLTLAARRGDRTGFSLSGLVSGPGGIVVNADDVYWANNTLSQGLVELRRGTNTYAGGTTVRYGRLKVSADGALGSGPVMVYNGLLHPSATPRTSLLLDATPDMHWTLTNALAGEGTVVVEGGSGSYRLTESGTVSPGTNTAAIAVLTVDGQFAFAKSGGTPVTLQIDVKSPGTTPGTDHDQLKVDHGDATLASSITNSALSLSLVPSPVALNGMTLTVLSASGADFSSYRFASTNGLGAGGQVLYSNGYVAVTWVAQTPVIQNGGYANLAATSCDVSGYLSSTGDTPTEVRCYWDINPAGTSGWGYTNFLGTQGVGTATTALTNLTGGVTYYYRFYATNGVGEYWSLATSNFTTLADVTWNDAASGNWRADNANTWGAGLSVYPQFPLNDTVIVDSHTVTVTGAQPAVKATWVTRTATTTGTLYYADSSVQTRDLNLAGGVLQLESADGGGAKITNSVIRVSTNSVVYSSGGGGQYNNMDTRIWGEIRDATNGTGLLTASGGTYVRTRLYGANTNFSGGWRVSPGRGLHVHAEGALGSGTATVDTAIEVMVDHTNTATCLPPARVICLPAGGVYLNNAFPGYNVTVKDWEIELRGGVLGFGPNGVGTFRGGHIDVVSNSTFYGRRDSRWGSNNRIEAEVRGTGRVTLTADAVDHGATPSWDGTYMLFRLSGNNTNFSGGFDHVRNQLYVEHVNALGTGPLLTAPTDLDSGLYFDRPGGNFDWTLANDISGGRGTNVAIKVEDGVGTNTLTVLGTVDPGMSGAAVTTNATGILRVDGDLAFGAGSRLKIDIAGTNGVAGVDFDRLLVDHDLTGLENAVLQINVNTNLAVTALAGQELVVVSNATELVGTFGSVEWNAPWQGRVVYNQPAGTVKLANIGLPSGTMFMFW